MGYTIADYDFDGPFGEPHEIVDDQAVFVVLCQSGQGWNVLDVDMAESVRWAIEHHPHRDMWKDQCYGGRVAYAVYYAGSLMSSELDDVVWDIREREDPPCCRES